MAPTPSRTAEYLTFRVGRADLAMRADCIVAFLPMSQLAPRDAAAIHAGVTDLAGFAMSNGRLIPVLDLARKLRQPRSPRGRTPCIVVVELSRDSEPYLSSFIADVVSDVISARARGLQGDILHTPGRPRRVIDPDELLRW